ncbi:MAG: metallophosphoesterase [Patescibacteria group bacterium]
MGRKPHRSKKFMLFGGIFRLALASFGIFALVYSVTFGIKWVSDYGLPGVLVKALPLSSVAGKYIDLSKVYLPELKAVQKDKLDEELVSSSNTTENLKNAFGNTETLSGEPLLTLCLLSDSHNDNAVLEKAFVMSKELKCEYVFFLGDFSSVGAISELEQAKRVMDAGGLPYYSLPGDHDLWKSGDVGNYTLVFGDPNKKIILRGMTFLFLDNSNNETGVSKSNLVWFTDELASLDSGDVAFVLLSNPLYNKSQFKLMGENSETVREQANMLLKLIRNSEIITVIAGDNHLSSRSADPEKPSIEHIVVGALTRSRNLQNPRFSQLTLFKSGNYKLKEVEVAF